MNRRSFLRIIPVAPIAAPAAALQIGQECPAPAEPLIMPAGGGTGRQFKQFVLDLAKRVGVEVQTGERAK